MCVRARVQVAKALTRFASLTMEGEGNRLPLVRYEEIPYFCQVCGIMGHIYEECGDGVSEAKDR